MKTRHGFVSNSSSSSFILILPDEFDLGLYHSNFLEYMENEGSCTQEEIMDLEKFKAIKEIDEYNNRELFRFFKTELRHELKKYEFESWDTSSDCGEIRIHRVSEVTKFISDNIGDEKE